jgi:ketosteroid isomerase-like protein
MVDSLATDDTAGPLAVQLAWAHAVCSNDADVIGHLMHRDWVIVTPGGMVTKEQFLGAIRGSALAHSRMEAAPGADGAARIRTYGDVTVVTQRMLSTEHQAGEVRDNDEWITNTLVRDGDRWVLAHVHLTPAQ